MSRRGAILALLLLLPPAAGGAEVGLSISSTVFAPHGEIPVRFTCEGEDRSPPLAWAGAPGGTKGFALIVDDPDAPDPGPKPTGAKKPARGRTRARSK